MNKIDYLGLDAAALQTVVSIYDTGKVAEAAVQLDVSQSTLSHRLKKARSAIGDPLFVPAGRNITPTPRLLEIIPLAKRILADMLLIVEADDTPPSEYSGTFVIASSDLERALFLFDAYRAIKKIAPNVRMDFAWPEGDDREALRDGSFDAVISILNERGSSEIHNKILFLEDSVCFYDASCREAPDSFERYLKSKHLRAMFSKNDSSLVDQTLEEFGHARNIAVTLPSLTEVPNVLRGSDLVAVLPAKLAKTIMKEFAVCPLPFRIEPYIYNLLWHEKTHASREHAWIRQQIINQVSLL